VPETQKTVWGVHENITFDLLDKPVRSVKGVIYNLNVAGGRLVASKGVLVEVFNLGLDSPHGRQRPDDEQRVAACRTGTKGRFGFNLPPGLYEVRASLSESGWKAVVEFVSVDVRKGAKKDLDIWLRVDD
jgi:hypothetical protein